MRAGQIVGIVLIVIGAILAVIGLFSVCTTSNVYSSLTGTPTCDETIAIAGVGIGLVVAGMVAFFVAPRAAPAPPPTYVPPSPTQPPNVMIFPGTPNPNPTERYCPVCGKGNSNAAQFCDRCGRPLPPPPVR